MSFGTRTELAARLENTFTAAFNERVSTHRVVKSGVEATEIHQFHDAIRYCYDPTSKYVRYWPDSVMLSYAHGQEDTALLEFKCAATGVRLESFLDQLRRACPDLQPPFSSRHDVYNIEADALDHYVRLAGIGVKVIIVAYRLGIVENPIRAQFVENIAVCNEYDPNVGGRNTGSGTMIANANFASFVNLTDFFTAEFSLDRAALMEVERAVIEEFR